MVYKSESNLELISCFNILEKIDKSENEQKGAWIVYISIFRNWYNTYNFSKWGKFLAKKCKDIVNNA